MEDVSTRLDPGHSDTLGTLPLEHPPVPNRVGRYVVLDEIGRGGMGVVLRAYDPRLQREVALKKMIALDVSPSAQARMVREARAMAKLSHPNTVAVYDVETHGHDVVLAMELVEGLPLSMWLKTKRSLQEVLAVFVAAGRGLAAAHDVGLLHRDFKPANVIVREDGRAQVTDFGLARRPAATDVDSVSDQPLDLGAVDYASVDTPLTVAGMVVGTPPYMAPEVHLGEALDASVDQYAFCVSLWRALTGQLPFSGELQEQCRAKLQGPPPWPSSVKVPAPIVAAIRRGLGPKPSDRWPSMEPLLAALVYDRSRRSRIWVVVALGAMAVGAAAVTASITGAAAERCNGAETAMAAVWDDEARAAVETALTAIDRPYAMSVTRWVRARLDQQAGAWIEGHREACEATTIRGEQSSAVMDSRMACLSRARQELAAVVGVLQRADAGVLDRAELLVAGMTDLAVCADVAALQDDVPPPADSAVAAAVGSARERLAEVAALSLAARTDEAEAGLAAIEADAEALDYPPLHTEILLQRGQIEVDRGRYGAGEAALRRALRDGLRWGQWRAAWSAARGLIFVVGEHGSRPETALAYVDSTMGLMAHVGSGGAEEASTRMIYGQLLVRLGRHAEAEAEERTALQIYEDIRSADHPDLARVRTNLAVALQAQGRYDEAKTELEAAKRIWEVTLSPDYPEATNTRADLGLVQKTQGEYEAAEATLRDVVETRERTLGPQHPTLLPVLQNLSNVLRAQGRLDEAETTIRRAIELARTTYGEHDVHVASARGSLALVLKARGDDAGAELELRSAIAVSEGVLGKQHLDVQRLRSNLANVLKNLGRLDEAEAELRSGLALERAALGPEHPSVATTLHNLANVINLAGRPEESAALFEQAAILREELLGPEHRDLASSLAGWGQSLLDQHEARAALEPLHRAWAIVERSESTPLERARVGFAYARARWEANEDRPRARELAESARAGFLESRGPEHESTREVVDWLAGHP